MIFFNRELKCILLFFSAIFVKGSRESKLLLINNYTFNRTTFHKNTGKTHWNCSARKTYNCTSAITTKQNIIIQAKLDHNHPARNYHITSDGIYIRV